MLGIIQSIAVHSNLWSNHRLVKIYLRPFETIPWKLILRRDLVERGTIVRMKRIFHLLVFFGLIYCSSAGVSFDQCDFVNLSFCIDYLYVNYYFLLLNISLSWLKNKWENQPKQYEWFASQDRNFPMVKTCLFLCLFIFICMILLIFIVQMCRRN